MEGSDGQRPDQRSVGLFIAHGYAGISTPVLMTASFLASRGYRVDLFVSEDPNCRQMGIDLPELEEARIRVRRHAPHAVDPRWRRWFRDLPVADRDLDFVAQHIDAGEPYQWLVGFDPDGLARAGLLGMAWGAPFVYHSLELDSSEGPAKEVERWFTARAILSLSQDRVRADALAQLNGVARDRVDLVYNSTIGGPIQEKRRYFHQKLQIPEDKRIVLLTGSLLDFSYVVETIESTDDWPQPFVLVAHGWIPDPVYAEKIRLALRGRERRAYLSQGIVPPREKLKIFQSADVGLALYRPYDLNFRLAAGSSGKMFDFMRVGVPIIGNRIQGMQDYLEGNGCGVVVDDPAGIVKALEQISKQGPAMSNGARASFKRYEFGSHYDRVLRAIERLVADREPTAVARPVPDEADEVRMGRLAGWIEAEMDRGRPEGFGTTPGSGTGKGRGGMRNSTRMRLRIAREQFTSLLGKIGPRDPVRSMKLLDAFIRTREICERSRPGNVVVWGESDPALPALLAWVCAHCSDQPRLVHRIGDDDGARESEAAARRLGVPDRVQFHRIGKDGFAGPGGAGGLGMIGCLFAGSIAEAEIELLSGCLRQQTVEAGMAVFSNRCANAERTIAAAGGFTLRETDGETKRFSRTEGFPLNEKVTPELAESFARDDPARFGIHGEMSRNERFQLYYAVQRLAPGATDPVRFMVIGPGARASLALMYVGLKRRFGRVRGYVIEPQPDIWFAAILSALEGNVRHLQGDPHQVAEKLRRVIEKEGNLPGCILVNGDGSYERTAQNIADYYPMLGRDGIIAFRGYFPELDHASREAARMHCGGREPGVRQACREWMEERFHCEALEVPLLHPRDPSLAQAHLPIIPGVFGTLRIYRKGKCD